MTTEKDDNLFGKVALAIGFITEEELTECIHLQLTTFKRSTLRLGDIMVQRGYLNFRQVGQILQQQRGVTIRCPQCNTPHNIIMFQPGSKINCYRCPEILFVPDTVLKKGFKSLVD